MADPQLAQQSASGIRALVSRLRDEGVSTGRAEAERLVAEAQQRARTVVDEAEAEAKTKVATARREADNLRRAGEDALRVAVRDAVLDLKDRLTRRFTEDICKIVSAATRDEELLKRMVLAVAGRARTVADLDQAALEIVLPRTVVGLDDLRAAPEGQRDGSLMQFVSASAASMLREGVTFGRADDDAGGIKVALRERGVTVDLTDRAVADVILLHLQPRFRALLEGVVA